MMMLVAAFCCHLILFSGFGVAQGSVEPATTIPTRGDILYVGGSGPGNYSRIQDAVDNTTDGDTVFVYDDAAPYYENIAIHTSIRLLGENRETTSIEGGHYAVTIYADNVTVSGFRISDVGDFWNCYGIEVLSDSNTITDNMIVNNLRMVGISLEDSSFTTVSDNIIENNRYHGIRLHYGSHDIVMNNLIVNNLGYGVYLWSSTDDSVIQNTIEQSYWTGLIVSDNCSNTTLYHNTLAGNAGNAYDVNPGNVWDNGSSGNYWSDYNGSDLNHDGIGDTPYGIPGNVSVDRYPLMEPFGSVQQPQLLVTIKGGVGITASVENQGSWDAIQVDWLWTLLGGYFISPSLRYQSGTIPLLTPGQIVVVVTTKHLFGFGLTNLVVNVGKVTAFQRGFLLGIFYLLLPSSK
jgi:parallel beta-helix repeat protein